MGLRSILALALILALPVAAQAKIEPSRAGRDALATFNRLDTNHDGELSVAELNARGKEKAADALFALLDANGNGKISIKELGAQNGALLARFDAYDVNKDGYVTRREFPNWVDPLLVSALDRDHDGRLSLAELRPAFAGARIARLPEKATVPPRRVASAVPAAQPFCWITGFGKHNWTLEAPVTWGGCRTR